jgi:predicted porin
VVNVFILTLKRLAALAALAATGAFAQSTVTIYGQADASYARASSGANSVSGIWAGGRGSNFVGFMGSEDLGGGLKANFKLEAGYSLDSGAGAASNTNNQATGGVTTQSGPATAPVINSSSTAAGTQDRASLAGGQGLTFNRWSYVGLSGGFGEVRVGREYTPSFNAILGADVVGANGVGNTLNMTLALQGQSANLIGVGTSASNGVSYETPSFNGLRAKVQVISGENPNGNGATGTLNAPKAGDGTAYHVYYNAGPLSAGVGGLTVKGTAVAASTGGSVVSSAGLPGEYEQASWYAKYDLGMALLTAGQVKETLNGSPTSTTTVYVNKSNVLGASIPVSGALKVNVNYVRSEYKAGTTVSGKGTQLSLQALYSLSKRTDLYAAYSVVDNTDANKFYGLGNGSGRMVTVPNNGDKSTGYQVGVRHNF